MDLTAITSTSNDLPSSWRNWTLPQWSQAFFHHFFEYGDEDTPVTRLVITDATWSAVTGDTSIPPAQMQQAFLDQFPRTRRDLDCHLSNRACRLPLHDFFPYLILTCLVAAASEDDAEAGQFPIRLYELLGMEGDSPLPFDGLGRIWKKLKDLLTEKRHQGCPCRELVLPNPGNEVRIGYSKRLAFPSRKDQEKLASLLNTLNRSQWLDEPPVWPVLAAVERQQWTFSTAFRDEFRDFQQSVSSGEETAAHPFWAAVRGVLRTSLQGTRTSTSRRTLDLLLFMEFDEFDEPILSLLSKTHLPWSNITSHQLDLDQAIAGYDRLAVVDGDPAEPARRLLSGGLSRSDIRSSLLEMVRDGLLIFQREDGYRIARIRPPEPGPATVLIHQDRKSAFVSALGSLAANHLLKPYPNTGWYWLDGLDGQQIPRLPGVRCLAQIARSASIGIYDGIRCMGGGYLSRFDALPEFRLEGSQRLRLSGTAPASAKMLTLYQGDTGWRLLETLETRAGIEGEFEVVAENRAGIRISARRIRFQRDVLIWDYGSPSDPTAWEIEAGRQATTLLGGDDRLLWDIGATWNPEQCVATTAPLPVSEPAPDWRYAGVGDLIEALAAIGTTRTLGLAETEFLDFLQRFLRIGEKDYRLLWDVARAWTEAGLLQRVSDRRWRNVRYLPQVPRLCVSRTVDGAWRGVVSGLMPASPSSRLANIAKISGIEACWVASVSPWLPPGLVLTATTAEALHGLAKNQELDLEIVMARSLVDVLAPLDQALRDDDPPSGYSLYAVWDWEQGRFQKFTDANSKIDNPGVFWYRRERGDQRDYFLACAEDGGKLWSYSRTWTLLAGARLLGRETFVYQPSEGLVRRAAGGIHLPIVVGRLAFALSGSASGPNKNTESNIIYRYTLSDNTQVEWVGTQLLGWVQQNQEHRQVPKWLRALALAQLSNQPSILFSTSCRLLPSFIPVSLTPIYKHFSCLYSKEK